MRLLRPLVLFAFVAAAQGCVSSSRFEDMQNQNRELAWKLDAAEKQTVKAEADKRLALKELELSRKDSGVLSERLVLEQRALEQARRDADEEMKSRLEEIQAHAPGKHEVSPYGGVVLETGILFESGRHELTKQGEEALAPLVEVLSGAKYEGYLIEIAGHTDSDPVVHTAKRYDDNHDLAAKRANSVRRFLASRGVPDGRLYLSAWGDTHPLGDEEKSKNRRVEILIHRTGPVELPASAKPERATPPVK